MVKKASLSQAVVPSMTIRGVRLYQGLLDRATQESLVGAVRGVVEQAPLFRPETKRGQKMSVRMTSAGKVGWVSDRLGYRYELRHPAGKPWPSIPGEILSVWQAVSGAKQQPDSCLINFYDADARMGMHQDRDEADLTLPVVSVSLGDDALFRIGSATRGGRTESVWLRSGDVLVLGGEARLLFHGIDRVRDGTSGLLPRGGRINLTLRCAL